MSKKVMYCGGGINKQVELAEYAVRGELVIKAVEIREQLNAGNKEGHPFKDVVFCNIGNPQALGQLPITFFRQVLAIVECPDLLKHELIDKIFPKDVLERAQAIIKGLGTGGLGAYTHSQGVKYLREEVAKFIAERDGNPADPEEVFLTDGASPGVKTAIQLLVRNEKDGIMIPIPQYPLYSASVALSGGAMVPYYLEEQKIWAMNIDALESAIAKAKADGITCRAICVINPGNPTSQCLKEDNMKEVVKFCEKHHLVLMADEVYQVNVYDGTFTSFKKVVREMKSEVELISYHSVSKGVLGECGHRGGYAELINIDPQVQAEWYKMASISLCPNTVGQVLTGLMVNPPKKGDASFELYEKESLGQYQSLKRRAERLVGALNKLEGVSCQPSQGAMYSFPTITLPPKAIEAAKAAGKKADTFYCLELLKGTGVCVVPGCGFGQVEGTFHFRTTFLPAEDVIDSVADRITSFHQAFMKQYA